MTEHRRALMQEMFLVDQNLVEMNQHEVSREPWVSLLKMAHPPKHLGFQVTTRWTTSSQRLNDMIMKQNSYAMDVTLA